MKRVCVFCGSGIGRRPGYAEAARRVADALLERGLELVYGGGRVGLMGIVADAVLAGGGEVQGVIPRNLFRQEVVHEGLTRLAVVETMLERKTLMIEGSDAFLTLPGGYGTIDELFEVLTWAQLGLMRKPCGLLNVDGYFDALLEFLERQVAEGYLRPAHRALLLVDDDAGRLLDALAAAGR